MAILAIRLQFHSSSPPLLFQQATTHITLCAVTYHHACNMVMVEAILCAASLSLCYIATCYGIDECTGSCWCMGDIKYKNSSLHIQAERTQIQWRRPSLVCCCHEVYNIKARRICIKKRFWLVGGRVIILNDFPLLHIYNCLLGHGCQITHRQKTVQLPRDQHELHQYHQSVQIWYIQFALQLWYHIRANAMHA